MIRTGCLVVALLAALLIGRLTVPEPPPRIERVHAPPIIVTTPAPAGPALPPARRATLEDVRRDWNITGRLACHAVMPAREAHP